MPDVAEGFVYEGTRIFASREFIQAYAVALGKTNALSIDPLTQKAYTAEQVASADLRGNEYVDIRWYSLILASLKADTVEELRPDVKLAFQKAAALASIRELETPHTFTNIINPAEDRELIEANGYKWRPTTHASSTEALVNMQPQEFAIHYLIDPFLPVPTDANNRVPETPTSAGVAGNRFVGIYGNRRRCR